MTQIINDKLKKCCENCLSLLDTPCAWLSLGNEYCDAIMEVNEEIERLNKENSDLQNITNIETSKNEYLEKENERLNKENNLLKQLVGNDKQYTTGIR